MWIFLFMLVPVLTLLLAGLYLALQVVRPKCFSVEETYRTEIETGRMDEAEWLSWEKQEVIVRSPYGYDLFGIYLPLADSNKTVVIAHGITYTLFGSVKYVDLFRRRGYNVLLYDHRNHGRSGGHWSTFGYYEKHDMKIWLEWAKGKLEPDGQVGVMGESYGAATAIQCLAETVGISFLICDCCFSDLMDLLTYHMRLDYRLPAFPLLYLASLWSKALTGMRFADISPVRDVDRINIPCLFIHGRNDQFTPARMSEALYDAKVHGIRELNIIPNADHAESYFRDPQAYETKVAGFLERNGF